MPQASSTKLSARLQRVRYWPAALVLLVSLAMTYGAYHSVSMQMQRAIATQFRLESESLQRDIAWTMQSYGQALRGGVGLFHAAEDISREDWKRYVEAKKFDEFAAGIQGLSFNAVLRGAEQKRSFEDTIRATDRPDFSIRPSGDRDLYVPVLYLEPLTDANVRAIGFDIYSEPNRRAAIDAAFESDEISMTAPITLVQNDTNDTQAGVLVVLPTYAGNAVPETATDRRRLADGLVVSVFKIGTLVETVLLRENGEMLSRASIYLTDTTDVANKQVMFHRVQPNSIGPAAINQIHTFALFGRTWTIQTSLSESAMAGFRDESARLAAAAGLAISLLLTWLAVLAIQRSASNAQAARDAEAYSSHVQNLMQEVNHRSKNLLALVRAIARLTASKDLAQFNSEFSKRIEGLAASQDILVRNDWLGIELDELVHSQLAHFEGLMGSRISASGPSFRLRPNAAQTIGMALHEMATNAGKYGALSNETGKIAIRWDVSKKDQEETLTITWIETGGPSVTSVERRGFGSAVFGSMAEHGLGGKAEARFDPEGFSWSLVCPADRAREGSLSPRQNPY